nr:agmatine deiminase family protein [Wolbachia endosymbiont of Fragariocoptes setiger]
LHLMLKLKTLDAFFKIQVNYVYQKDLDIWIRDFAPLITKKGFYQYIYKPEYIQYSTSSKIRKAFSCVTSSWPSVQEIEVINDGGNFIHNGRSIIMTDKIYDLNPQLSREKINLHFYEIGAEKIVIIPQDKNDITGHADGMVKWIDENQLFVTKYEDEKLYNKILEILEQQLPDVKIHELDFKNLSDELTSPNKNQLGKVEDATGIYVNFLQTKNAVYVPIYGNEYEDNVVKKKNVRSI